MPPPEIRRLRALTRYRKTQIEERTREVQRLDKVLQDGIKLGSVATDILGRSGRDMLDALVAGTTDPERLAGLARGVLRKKVPALVEALEGRFGAEHRVLVARILAEIAYSEEAIAALSAEIEAATAAYEHHIDLLCTIPGVRRRTAEYLTPSSVSTWPLRERRAALIVGGGVPWQQRVRRQAPARPAPPRPEMARRLPRRSSPSRRPHRHLPRRPIPAAARPARAKQNSPEPSRTP